MRLEPGVFIEVDIDKAAVGGRMLGRLDGQVVLVSGAIPGERVVARVERHAKGVAYAQAVDVLTASADRRPALDFLCGGQVYAHIAYPRQLQLKAAVIGDAFARLAKLPLSAPPAMIGSPERGYRMRARLHVQGEQIGFYREGTHQLCDPASGEQLSSSSLDWIRESERALRLGRLNGLAAIELAENVPADQRACHLELHPGAKAAAYGVLDSGLVGLSAHVEGGGTVSLSGAASVSDVVRVNESTPALQLRRNARAFFQGNRFLLEPLVQHVSAYVSEGPVLDLYAGVGLFGLTLAAAGVADVTLVEGDAVSCTDLSHNAEPFRDRVRVEARSVESFLDSAKRVAPELVCIVDPPRTGLTRFALSGMIRCRPRRVIYVSCDVATLARDARAMGELGYQLVTLTGIDLFPNTAHVESVAVFDPK